MPLGKQLRNPIVQQYVLEIVFPLVGYFFFDWDILIIGVYYLIDHLCSQIMFFRRAYKANKHAKFPKSTRYLVIAIVIFLVFFSVETIGLGQALMVTESMPLESVLDSFYTFAKEELWILFPVVLIVYHFKDQLTYYMPRRFMNYDYQRMVFYDLLGGFIILFLLFSGGALWIVFDFSPLLAIIIFVIIKVAYDLTIKRYILKQSLHTKAKSGH
jgi:hypothetical protein